MQTVKSDDYSLGDIFNDYYVVPSYQREYVWGEEQVEQLLRDVYDEYDGSGGEDEYFVGSIVVCPVGDVLELIDGQQRMTTAFVVMCAIRDRLTELGEGSVSKLDRLIAETDVNAKGEDTHRYRVVLQYQDSAGVLEQIAEGHAARVTGSTRSVQNILTAYRTASAFLRAEFGDDGAALRQFFAHLIKKVKLIRVQTPTVAHALKVFETINDRGVGLDAMDLLKNLLFMKADRGEFGRLKDQWKVLVDTLYEANEKPLRFLRYYVFAEFEPSRLKEDQIYRWFSDNAAAVGYEDDPVGFVERLVGAARSYVLFLQGKDARGQTNRYLTNLRLLSGVARQHLIPLLAGRDLGPTPFDRLCREIEGLFFAYIVTRESTKDYEPKFIRWAKQIGAARTEAELDAILDDTFVAERAALAPRFALAFEELTDRSIQQYRMRYILGKLTQHVNERAWGTDGSTESLEPFVSREVDVEHVLPLSLPDAATAHFPDPEETERLVHMLGNLTLLEKTINRSIQADAFGAKRAGYGQSKFLLTKLMGGPVTVGTDTALNRAVDGLAVYDEWDPAAVRRRQSELRRLAHAVWDVPLAEPTPVE